MSNATFKILITGGAGCLGSNLIEHWLPVGHQIMVLDNFVTGKREVVPNVSGLIVREGSVADKDFVDNCFADFNPDIVIHSAASYQDPDDWATDIQTNILGSSYVLRAAEKYDVKRLINFQTTLCYGRPQNLAITTDHPLAPFTSYGISKTAGEQFMLMSEIPVVSLRISNVTGPRLSIGPIPTFYKRLKAGQNCFCSSTYRDFLDISDFLNFMDLVLETSKPVGVFNVSSGVVHSIKEVFDLVCTHLDLGKLDVPIIEPSSDDVPVVNLSSTATELAFGWKAQISFEDTIMRQLQWYDAFGITDIYSHLKASNTAVNQLK